MALLRWLLHPLSWLDSLDRRHGHQPDPTGLDERPDQRAFAMQQAEDWEALDPALRRRMVMVLQTKITDVASIEHIQRCLAMPGFPIVDETPDDEQVWAKKAEKEGRAAYPYIPAMFHFGTGMGVRNLLRANGITDDLFPSGNLDDYYAEAIREAFGS